MIEKRLRKYIVPNIFAMMGTSCYVLADTFFVAVAEGVNGITALNLILPLYGLIYALGSMIGIGSATRYSLQKAAGKDDAGDYFANSILWTVLISVIFMAAGIFFPDTILRFMGADEVILATGLLYVQIVLCFTPFFMLNYTFTAFVRNDGAPNIAMAATVLSGIFNIIFDYIFMFPLEMGMAGAALATAISPIVSMAICMVHYLSKKNNIYFVKKLPSWSKLLSSCNLGIVAFVGEISSGITTMVFNLLLLGLVGNIGVAAYGVIANMALVGTALFNGVSQGLQPLASAMHGKGQLTAEKKIYWESLKIGGGIAIALVAIVMAFAGDIVGIFNREHSVELAAYAEQGIKLYFLGFLLAAINIVRAGFYSAIGRGQASSIISLSRGVLAIIAFAFVLSKCFGIVGLWLAFPASELFTLLLTELMIKAKRIKAAKEAYCDNIS